MGGGRNGERERGRGREGVEWKVKGRAGGDRWEKEERGEIEPARTHVYTPAASTPTNSAFTW